MLFKLNINVLIFVACLAPHKGVLAQNEYRQIILFIST
jgi:hypothetical protein